MENERHAAQLQVSERACVSCGTSAEGEEHRCQHCGAAQRVGSYVVERLVHQGPRGRMYVARSSSGQRVALKELVFATVPDVAQIDAFEREGAVLRQLAHPSVPTFIEQLRVGAGVHTRLYLAQQLVEGESLLARLQRHRFDEAEVRGILRDVLQTLRHLHGLSPRLLHRDLKPANLIRRMDGSIAVVDFGASRDLAGAHTHGASLVGTIGYMPPEQLGGTVSPASDLYALGASMVHLLSRTEPSQLLNAQLELEVDRAVNVSGELKRVLQRLTAREPANRFQSAEEVSQALEGEGLAGPTVNSVDVDVVETTWPELERRIRVGLRESGAVGAFFAGVSLMLLLIPFASQLKSMPVTVALASALWVMAGLVAARWAAATTWPVWLPRMVETMLPGQPEAQARLLSQAKRSLGRGSDR